MITQVLNTNEAAAFANRMLAILKSGTLALMSSIEHRTKLFNTMTELPPSISQPIADAAKLNKYYMRKWLGATVTGRIVDYDHSEKQYVQILYACGKLHPC